MSNEIVLELIETNLLRLMADEFYNGIELVVSKERLVENSRENKKNRIYVVVQFLESGITAGHTIQPIQLLALTEHNNIVKVEALLRSFAEIYNTKVAEGGITQYYLTPVMISAFNEVYDGYRGVYALNGTLLIAPNSNPLKYVEVLVGGEFEKVELIGSQLALIVQTSPDTYIGENGFTKAHPIQSTLTLNLTFYMTQSPFCVSLLNMALTGNLQTLTMRLSYNHFTYGNLIFQVAEINNTNQIGQLPVMSITLTRGV